MPLSNIKISLDEAGFGKVEIDGREIDGCQAVNIRTHYNEITQLKMQVIGSFEYEGPSEIKYYYPGILKNIKAILTIIYWKIRHHLKRWQKPQSGNI